MIPTLWVMLLLLQLRRLGRASTQPGMGDLLDDTEQGGDDDGGLEGLPEYYEENRNGEHVRHDCFGVVARTNDGVQEGESREKGGEAKKADVGETSWRISLYNTPVVIR